MSRASKANFDYSCRAMNRAEAQKLVEAELERELEKGYEELSALAPRPLSARRGLFGFFRRQRWYTPEDSYVITKQKGQSGADYYVEREIFWDDEYKGALRVWIYVHDGRTAEHPESGCDLLYPPGHQ